MRLRFLVPLLGAVPALAAQEMEPRSYSPSPVGASFFATLWTTSSGDVLEDPTVPLKDVNSRVEVLAVGYGHTFNMFGRQALVTVALPYAWAWMSGKVGASTTDTAISRSGIADMRAKLSVNLLGSPSLSPAEFAKQPRAHWIVGTSLAIIVPTGQYFPYRVINIGTDRWAFKPELGVSYNKSNKLYLDLYAGVWLFTPNPAFFPGTSTRTEDPLWSLQLHASYNFTKRIFAALESTWYSGGSAEVDGGPPTLRQQNTRIGALFAYGFTDRQSVKISYDEGAIVRAGQDFKMLGVAYQVLWF